MILSSLSERGKCGIGAFVFGERKGTMANGVAVDVAFIRRAAELCSLVPTAQKLSVS